MRYNCNVIHYGHFSSKGERGLKLNGRLNERFGEPKPGDQNWKCYYILLRYTPLDLPKAVSFHLVTSTGTSNEQLVVYHLIRSAPNGTFAGLYIKRTRTSFSLFFLLRVRISVTLVSASERSVQSMTLL